ncbi:folate hydrolase, partial [bacterium]
GVFAATSDPKQPLVAPKAEEIPPNLNFAPLDNAIDALTASAGRYSKAVKKFGQKPAAVPASLLAEINQKLIRSDRLLTSSEGLPGRPWFKNLIYAPGFYTGYGVKTIPGVREAIEQKRWKEAEAEIFRAAATLRGEAVLIGSLATDLEQALQSR